MERSFTKIETANLNFFGNLVTFGGQIDEIRSYLNEIHKFIEVTNFHLQNDKIKGYDIETLEMLKYNYEYSHGDILRKSILISINVILELGIDRYCKDFQKHGNFKISYKELKGDLLERFKTYSLKILNSKFDFNSCLWSDIIGLYEVRNCLIHNNASLINFGKKRVIEEFILRNKAFEITDNEYICITHQACIFGLDSVENFYSKITEFAFEVFPTKHLK